MCTFRQNETSDLDSSGRIIGSWEISVIQQYGQTSGSKPRSIKINLTKGLAVQHNIVTVMIFFGFNRLQNIVIII